MHLQTHTRFSLRYGAATVESLLQAAKDKGHACLALTDINNTSVCLDFIRLAPRYGIHPLVGIDFRNNASCVFIGLAKTNHGFFHLNELLSHHQHHDQPFEVRRYEIPDAYVIYPFAIAKQLPVDAFSENEWIGIRAEELNQVPFSSLKNVRHKMVILQPASFSSQRDFNIHRLLRSIANNTLLSKLPVEEQGQLHDQLWEYHALTMAFAEYPEIIENTQKIVDSCSISFDFGTEQDHKNLSIYSDSESTDALLLRQMTYEGLDYRYPDLKGEAYDLVVARIDKELEIIVEKKFTSYFLINWDITTYARGRGYFYVGRGSGANSIVAYLLRITDVDPIELDLYFERFINLYRKNPPDFDIDFSWTDREDITNYIFSRFPNATLLGAYNTFQYKAIVRELGKVFGLPKHEIDVLSDGKFDANQLDQTSKLVLKYAAYIQDYPNHISIHAAGILISDLPIHHYTATFLPPKGFPTTHFDMVVAEDIGLYKFDILSQRGLGKIKETLDIIRYNQPDAESFDIHDMRRFKSDETIKHLLRTAQAIGCFYVESPAMRMLLTKLQVDDYLGLVAASSVIRPGVSRSGMMREFILRHRFPEKRKNAHPVLLDIMPDTYGVMVYQEDVIKVAHYFGGLTLSEADSLRRGMSGKFRGREEFDHARQAFFEKSLAKGHTLELTAEIWRQIESFAGYAFAKGHSASYAVESYQSLFLKAYYPLEYMTATINNFGGFYSTEIYVHHARMLGATIEPPCVNKGNAEALIYGKTIVLGFGLIKNVEHTTIENILHERNQHGDYHSFDDFLNRVGISLEQTSVLIRAGAFRFTQRSKKDLLWEAHFRLMKNKKSLPEQGLFKTETKTFQLPPLEHSWIEDAYDEIELIGFSLSNPFQLLKEDHAESVLARELPNHIGKEVHITGYLVTIKPTRTIKNERMYFGTLLDREGEFLDTVHFPPVAQEFSFQGKGIYHMVGKVIEEFGTLSIEVSFMEKCPLISDPRFHELDTTERLQIFKKKTNDLPFR